MSDGIISIDQVQTGFVYDFPRIRMEREWDRWYGGDYASLLPNATIGNGLKLFDRTDLIKVNLPKILSGFIEIATLAEPPNVSSDSAEAIQWTDENFEAVYRVIKEGGNWWSRKRVSVWVTFQDGTMDTIDPSEYIRVGRVTDPDVQVGHIILQVYTERTPDQLLRPNAYVTPNRIKVYRYAPSFTPPVNVEETYEFTGTETYGVVGNLLESKPAEITSMFVAGDRRPWMQDAKDLMARFMIKLTNLDTTLNHYDNAPRLIPNKWFLGDFGQRLDLGEMTPTQRLEAYRNAVRPSFAVDDESGNIAYAVQEPAFEYSRDLHALFDHILMFTIGASPQSVGFNLGAGESGIAREKAQDMLASICRSFRRDLEFGLPILFTGLGAPAVPYSFSWASSPFENRLVAAQEIRSDLMAGIIDVPEARYFRGYAEKEMTEQPADSETGTTTGE